MKIYDDVTALIGNTPVIRASRFAVKAGVNGEFLVKAESFNPCGSAKDRVGLAMIEAAEKSGKLKAGGTVIEPTSGNTGIGLAMACAVRGYKLILTMPESMSAERRKILSALGAKLVLTEAKKGMQGAVEKAKELLASTENAIIPDQFSNPANPEIHEKTTAEEIIADLDGKLDFFVAGVGTGGTISGVGKTLKARVDGVKVIAVEPFDSPLISKGYAGAHKLQGIGANFLPATLNKSVLDDVIAVKTEEAYFAARTFARTEGFTVGISGGAALFAATEVLKRNPGKRVLVFLPDGGDRYLSTDLYE